MSKETAAELFIGTDRQFIFSILNEDEDEAIDITGWSLSYMIKKSLGHADIAAKVTKITPSQISIAGTYASDPTLNAQVATVTITDTDTDSLSAGDYFYELKRMDAGAETILAYGSMTLLRSVHRS